MKHLTLFFSLFLLLLSNGIEAQNSINFSEESLPKLLERSKKENKPIFLMIYAEWCPHCNKMKKEVFNTAEVADFMEKNFICAWQDVEKENGDFIKKKFDVKSYPTFVFLDKNETLLYNLSGEYKTDALIQEAKNALNPKMQLPYLEQQFLNDPSNVDKCLAYILTLGKGKERKQISIPAHKYLATQKEQDLVSDKNWKVIANAVTDIESREFQYVLKNQPAFEKLTSPLRVERKINSMVSESLKPFTENLDTIQYFKNRKIAKTISLHKTDSLIFMFDVTLAERTQNWNLYKKTTAESVEKYYWNDSRMLKEIGQTYLKNIATIPDLNNALKWTERAITLEPSYDGYLLTAQLYHKAKDNKQAIVYAQKAKDFSESMGWNPTDAKKLLLKLGVK
ncbi:thioredoxin-related protein [Flavobacterium arsenatis]|uniref:Thioredoxin-related protein n=1 Tax=Flavobacterium arsenatis TaxID=1484332 RepID=A0ABU1TQY6_9FLAO|nr:thioredoxin family protein [Flavobacterium arsenatis]MDR6968400.1 thioredoxin-related protein [Flavobacterium arsenatis]